METLTERLRLRPFSMSDVEDYHSITRDSEIQEWVAGVCSDTLNGSQKIISNIIDPCHDLLTGEYSVVIEEKEKQKMIGALLVCEKEIIPSLDISLMMSKDNRRQGYMTEALKGFVKAMPYGTLLSFRIKEGNEISLSTVNKLGKLQQYNDPFDKMLHYNCYYYFV